MWSREIDGIRRAIEGVKPYEISDQLSDAYFELWDIATESNADFSARLVNNAEKSLPPDIRRRNKVVRRLAILASYHDDILQILEREQEYEQDELVILPDIYMSAVSEIQKMYDISDEDVAQIAARVRLPY